MADPSALAQDRLVEWPEGSFDVNRQAVVGKDGGPGVISLRVRAFGPLQN